jgi:hypothetical protein
MGFNRQRMLQMEGGIDRLGRSRKLRVVGDGNNGNHRNVLTGSK